MARRRSAGLLATKYLVAPALLAGLGYFVVGPRLGGVVKRGKLLQQAVQPRTSAPATQVAASAEGRPVATSIRDLPEPEVTVRVKPASETRIAPATEEPKPRRRRRRRRRRTTETAPTNAAPNPASAPAPAPADPAGAGGTDGTG